MCGYIKGSKTGAIIGLGLKNYEAKPWFRRGFEVYHWAVLKVHKSINFRGQTLGKGAQTERNASWPSQKWTKASRGRLNLMLLSWYLPTHYSSDFGLLAFTHVHIFNPVFIPEVTGSPACKVALWPCPSGWRFFQKMAFPVIGLKVMPAS